MEFNNFLICLRFKQKLRLGFGCPNVLEIMVHHSGIYHFQLADSHHRSGESYIARRCVGLCPREIKLSPQPFPSVLIVLSVLLCLRFKHRTSDYSNVSNPRDHVLLFEKSFLNSNLSKHINRSSGESQSFAHWMLFEVPKIARICVGSFPYAGLHVWYFLVEVQAKPRTLWCLKSQRSRSITLKNHFSIPTCRKHIEQIPPHVTYDVLGLPKDKYKQEYYLLGYVPGNNQILTFYR